MDIILYIVLGGLLVICILAAFYEYRIRQLDVLALYETKGQIGVRKGLVYPRHFSLALKRTTYPIKLTIEAVAAGNLGVRVKIVGSVAPSLEHIPALIRVGGWNSEAVARAADEAQMILQGLVKEYTECSEISKLSSTGLLNFLNERSAFFMEQFGVELISLAVQSLDATDPEITEALSQQEQARLLEQTERVKHQARVAAAKVNYQANQEIAEMEHTLDLRKAELKQGLLEKEAALAYQSLEDELKRDRMRLAFEREELEALKSSPELLMLTPQAARLAEASQNLKNARTVISISPQEIAHSPEYLTLFQNLLQKALEGKKET
jgi:hypothetical protein